MSELIVSPLFDGCCSGATTPQTVANPNLYYDITLFASATAAGLVPPTPSLPCAAFEINGSGPSYVWNPTTGTWK